MVRLVLCEDNNSTLHYHHDLVGLLPAFSGPAEAGRGPARKAGADARNPSEIGNLAPIFNDEDTLAKAASIPLGTRWIRVRPNGFGTESHTTMQGRDEPGPRANLAVRSEPLNDEDPLLKVACSPALPVPCAPPG